jgi:hypothetical protein
VDYGFLSSEELTSWLWKMIWFHSFCEVEVVAAGVGQGSRKDAFSNLRIVKYRPWTCVSQLLEVSGSFKICR